MLDPRQTVANLVLSHSECAPVFSRHKIDYCCRGNTSLADACASRGIDVDGLIHELDSAIHDRRGPRAADRRTMPTEALVDHIVTSHHHYLRKTLPYLTSLAAKVGRVHGEHAPKLRALAATVRAIDDVITPHLDFEERELFPAMLAASPDRARIGRMLETMGGEHLELGGLLEKMREETDDFTIPEWACTSYRTLFAELENLEADVHEHVLLENNVLAPRFHAA